MPFRVAILALLSACSEYDLKQEDGISGDSGAAGPDIAVDPSTVTFDAFCGARDQDVTISNVGTAPLNLSEVVVTGDGWVIATPEDADRLGPGDRTVLTLEGTDGAATLAISSDDPDEPVIEVPLAASPDRAPAVSILSPTNGSIFDIGAASALEGSVSDDLDAPDALALSWASDVDGVFNTDFAAVDGTASATWDATARSPGAHVVTFTATDSCGNTGSAEIGVCQQAGYTSDELDIASWHTEGYAAWDDTNHWVQLTDTGGYETGSAFATDSTVSGGDVNIEFSFYVGGGSGADGFSLTALDTTRITTFLGSPGCGLGYAGPSASICVSPTTDGLPGWSVEVDTHYNGEVDPTEDDHVCFTFDGNVTDYQACAALPEMEDTGWHTFSATVLDPHVDVAIDGVIYIDQDVSETLDFPAYVGFTAATGGSTNYHRIASLEVTELACE